MKRAPMEGILRFQCPQCAEVLEVRCGIVDAYGQQCREVALRHRPRPVEFVAEATHLHAVFWGHMVRCHQPNPHPYMSSPVGGGLGE